MCWFYQKRVRKTTPIEVGPFKSKVLANFHLRQALARAKYSTFAGPYLTRKPHPDVVRLAVAPKEG